MKRAARLPFYVFVLGIFSGILSGGVAAWAADPGSVSTITSEKATSGLLKDERFSFKPLIGTIAYTDIQGNNTARGAAGLTLDMNLMTMLDRGPTQIYAGPAIGVIASHMGDPTSNFFGSNADLSSGQSGANLVILPANLKVGYAFTDYYRIAAHGGGNVIYRSVANSVNLGDGSDSAGSLWRMYPNIGADLDIAISKKVALTLRPDWTLAPNNDLFTGSIALGIFTG